MKVGGCIFLWTVVSENWNTPIKVPIKAAIDGVIDGTRSVTVDLTVKVENIAIITNVKTVQVITYPLYHCKICINQRLKCSYLLMLH